MLRPSGLGPVDSFATRDHASAVDGFRHFLDRHADDRIEGVVAAAAGPVRDGRCTLTNAAWTLDGAELARDLGLRFVRIVNDLEALAWAVPRLAASDVAAVGGGEPVNSAPVALIAPGTGLGMACFLPGVGPQALASEGGHATLPATTEDEAEVIGILRRRIGHVSAERVLSGPGLVRLHEALGGRQAPWEAPPSPEEIVRAGVAEGSAAARRTLDLFCAFLGSVAGNAALTFGARGGVLIGGGIVPRIVERVRASSFRERFEGKGRLRPYLAQVPTRIIVRPEPTFLGLEALARSAFS